MNASVDWDREHRFSIRRKDKNMNNNSQPWYCSWWAIIIAFIIFWPVGIVLLILRNSGSKQSVFLGTTSKKKYIIAGIILIFLGLIYFSNGNSVMGFFMIIGGIALIVYAEKLTKRAQRNRQYIDLIVNQNETSLDKIANICNIQYDKVLQELKQLVNMNVLKNAVIDENYRTITVCSVPIQQEAPFSTISNALNMETAQNNEKITCTCSGCGAKVILPKGVTVNCEYCDAPICAK